MDRITAVNNKEGEGVLATEVSVPENDRSHPIIKYLMSFVAGIFRGHKPVKKEDVALPVTIEGVAVLPVPIKKVVAPCEEVVIVPQILTGTERAKAIARNREETRRKMEELDGDLQRQLDFFDENPCLPKKEDD